MLSFDYELSVPGFSAREIGLVTLVRSKAAKLEVHITNDSSVSVSKMKVKILFESYIGQPKVQLVMQSEPQIINTLPQKGMVPLTFQLRPFFPGLVSVAVIVTDSFDKTIKAKRSNEDSYKESPVRWWFHVEDNISVEILRTLKKLLKQESEGN